MRSLTSRKKLLIQAAAATCVIGGLAGCFPDGTFTIGGGPRDVKPGLYTSNVQPGGNCQITRKIVNDPESEFGLQSNAGRSFLQVPNVRNQYLISSGCGIWVPPKPTSYNPNRVTAKYGQYRIPTDLLPGTYVAPGFPGCAWQLLSDFTASPQSILSTTFEQKGVQPRVTITKTDAGFSTNPCGGWKRIGP